MNPSAWLQSHLAYFDAVRSVNLESVTFADRTLIEQAQMMILQDHFLPGFALPAILCMLALAWRARRGQGIKTPFTRTSAGVWTVLGTICAFAWYMTGNSGFSSIEIGPLFSMVLIASEMLRFTRLAPGERYVPRLDATSMFVITYLQLLFADVVVAMSVGMGITWLGGVGLNDALIRTPLVMAAFTGLATAILVFARNRDLADADHLGAAA